MERNINVREKHRLVASCTPPTRDLACNPGMCPNRESNQQPFCSQATLNPLSHTSQDNKQFKTIKHVTLNFPIYSITLVGLASSVEKICA